MILSIADPQLGKQGALLIVAVVVVVVFVFVVVVVFFVFVVFVAVFDPQYYRPSLASEEFF